MIGQEAIRAAVRTPLLRLADAGSAPGEPCLLDDANIAISCNISHLVRMT